MTFLEELKWRGLIHDSTPGLEEELAKGVRRAYVGFDPTAPSLTIGNLVPIMLLVFFQRAGHQPVVLMGGATGRIGDPSGKDAERQLKSYEVLDKNLAHQVEQFKKFFQFGDEEQAAIMVNNLDIYQDMNVLDFLRDVGKSITINYMLAKDSVKNRLDKGLSFTEFSYQLLQGYDFQWLYENKGVTIQMGGSDQWGNIVGGSEFIRRNVGGKAYALTTPLLTKADGKKFGKSEKGNIWLSPELTSPYEFYQFWINADDADLSKFLRTFSLKTKEEIEAIEAKHAEAPHLRYGQKALAEELTVRIHSRADYEAALQVSELLFNKKASKETLFAMSADSLTTVSEELPSFEIDKAKLEEGVQVLDLLAKETKIYTSNGEARRSIKGNALSLNKDKVKGIDLIVNTEKLVHGKYLMVEVGKKKKYMIVSK